MNTESSRGEFDHLLRKWAIKILLALAEKELRFGELRRAMSPVSSKILTERLRELSNKKLIERQVIPDSPPTVHYRLSARGRGLIQHLKAMKEYGE